MEEISFIIQGSSDEPYEITFKKIGKNFSANCTCPAAQNMLHCKHRLLLLEGKFDKLDVIKGSQRDLDTVLSWLPGSSIEKVLQEVKTADLVVKQAQNNFKALKRKMARIMSMGT